jgi:alkanesulfonate monooxygenase SsuD/methylene tetrahydromethanopterin reductase-like flavin-dependent oxidoreductase (luciferase family)
MAKPFRFGVQLPKEPSASQWRDTARKIEDLGYATLFMPDHFGDELAPMPAIAMAAAHTTTLRIGSLVFDNDYKHPAILAKEAATIDFLSDGRLEFGLGAGWMRTDYDMPGLP